MGVFPLSKTVVMLITNPFEPDPRPLKEAKTLLRNGYRVRVIAWDREGNVEYRKREVFEGIPIIRIKTRIRYGIGIRAVWHFFVYYLLSTIRCLENAAIDIIYCHDFDTFIPGLLISRLRKAPLVLDLHEIYEGMAFKNSPMQKKIMGILLWVLKKAYYARVALFVYVSEKAKELDEEFVGKRIHRYTVIRNLPERAIIEETALERVKSEGESIRICFFGRIRDVELLAAVGKVIERLDGKYRFILAGSGPDAERIARKVKSFRYCRYLGPYKYNQLPTLYKNMDVVCTLYTMDLNTINAIPVKFHEAVALALPVIAFSGTRLGALCTSRGVGIAIDDLADLAERLTKMNNRDWEELKKNVAEFRKVQCEIFWENQESRYLNAMSEI